MQVDNINSFLRWRKVNNEGNGPDTLALNLRFMAMGIMKRPGARQSRRYWGKIFPSLIELMVPVNEKCLQLLSQVSNRTLGWAEADEMQQCIIVACQVLMPPIRGKPFYDLSLRDEGDNSMVVLESLI